MSRQFRSDDTVKWTYGFGYGTVDATITSSETYSWNGTTRFGAYGTITSATAGQTTFPKPSGWGHIGFCLLHQTRGTNAGVWELSYVDFSGAQAVADKPLSNSYSTSGNNIAQIVTLSNGFTGGYRNLTINSGVTLSVPAWNGSVGGILPILASGTVTVAGTMNLNGNLGASGNPGAGGTGGGFRGGIGRVGVPITAYQGEGTSGPGGESTSANGNGGGGGRCNANPGDAGGGGGGNGEAGGTGEKNKNATGGAGGATAGNAQLTNIVFGGGGGGQAGESGTRRGGSSGGGICIIIAKTIIVSGSITAVGGGIGEVSSGGVGGGGSVLLKAQTATLGTNLIKAHGGAEAAGLLAGNGGAGRIHIDYKTSYTGTTNPTLDVRQDSTLNAVSSGFLALL